MSEQESQHEDHNEDHKNNSDLALPGQRLKRTREELRLSRDEVAHHLHLDVQVVDALEANAFDKLPSAAYICGYLRSYARILKLPENDIVNAYSKGQEINASLIPDNIKILPERHFDPANFKMILIVIAVIAVSVGLLWAIDKFKLLDPVKLSENSGVLLSTQSEIKNSIRPAKIQKQIEQFNSENPGSMPIIETEKLGPDVITEENSELVVNFSEEQENIPVQDDEQASTDDDGIETIVSGDLKLIFTKDSWTEVTDSKGIRHVYRLVSKGNELVIDGSPPFTILLGDAEGVEVIYQEKTFNHRPYQRDQIAYFRLGVASE